MNSKNTESISDNKLKQAILLYGLINPFSEKVDAQNYVTRLSKKIKQTNPDINSELHFLYIFASLLKIPQNKEDLKSMYTLFDNLESSQQLATTLFYAKNPYEKDTHSALTQVQLIDETLKRKGIEKNLRNLAIIASLSEEVPEPVHLSKTLLNIQELFSLTR